MAENYTLKIDAGADFFLTLRLKNGAGEYIDLTNCEGRMKLKRKHDDTESLVSLTSNPPAGISFESWDDSGSYADTCSIHITNEQTGGLVDYTAKDREGDVEPGEGVYDLEITDTAECVTRVIHGYWIAFAEATK